MTEPLWITTRDGIAGLAEAIAGEPRLQAERDGDEAVAQNVCNGHVDTS